MTRQRSIWLVARREVIERGRSRGFVLSVLFTTVLVLGSVLIPPLLFAGGDRTVIGVVEPTAEGLDTEIRAVAARFERDVAIESFDDDAIAEAALAAGEIEVVVAVPTDLSDPGTIRFHEAPDPGLAQIISTAVVGLRVSAVLEPSDVDQMALAAAQAPPSISALDPQTAADEGQFLLANIGAVLVLVGIFSFGFTVLTGVVEEKQSRVVEVVLSTVRPKDLLIGKVLGIGVLGVAQLIFFVVAALGAATLTDQLTVPGTTPGAVVQLGLWFILGYTLYATALGVLGALASRMEEASNASTPVTTVAIVSYFIAIFAVSDDPNGPVAVIATFLPPSAPFVVPLRAAFDAIAPWEIALAVATTLAGIWILFSVGARVYAGAVLQTTGRMKLRDAWRSASK